MWPAKRFSSWGARSSSNPVDAPASSGTETVGYGTLPTKDRTWKWEKNGHASALLMNVLVLVGNRAFYLVLICMNVIYTREHLMSCNPAEVGYLSATVCEFTKTFVRFFPILGILVVMLAASRVLLQQRLYYQLLKRGALVDFANFDPIGDPLFKILVFDFVLAMVHYVMLLWKPLMASMWTPTQMDKALLDLATTMASQYVVPAMVFLSFLYTSYDTEATLVPLSKYFEEDPEVASGQLNKLDLLPESVCAKALHTGFWQRLEAKVGTSTGEEEGINENKVFQEFIKETASRIAGPTQVEDDGDPPEFLSGWRLVSQLWPGRILLHPSFKGKEAEHFHRMWYVFNAFTGVLFLLSGFWMFEESLKKASDMLNGQASTDWSSLLVIKFHMGLWFFLTREYLRNTWLPKGFD